TVIAMVPAAVARMHHVIPLRLDGKALLMVMGNPFDVGAIRAIERSTGKHVRAAAADPSEIARLLESVYGAAKVSAPAGGGGDGQAVAARNKATWSRASRTSVVQGAITAVPPADGGPARFADSMTAADLAANVIKR